MQVVLASRNSGKLSEMRQLFAHLPLTLESQADYNVPGADETGSTFVENAIIKARAVSLATSLPAIADDSGLVVPALNGAPGIYSARYAGRQGDDAANNQKLIEAMRSVDEREAYFYCAMVFMLHASDPTPLIATAAWAGEIVDQAAGDQGFGYDPHFFLPGLGQTSAELPKAQKNKLSHRGQAAAKLLVQLQKLL